MDRYSKSNKRKALKEEYAKCCVLYMDALNNQKEVLSKLNSTKDSMKIINYKKELRRANYKVSVYKEQKNAINNKLNIGLKTRIPLLLFAINESRYSLNGEFKPMWEYVYYYPDYDEVVKKTRLGTLSLKENDVNLTDLFFDLGMPEELGNGSIEDKYSETIKKAVDTTKILIDQIFEDNDINDWKDVSAHLKKYVETKNKIDQVKGIKHLKLI